MDSLPGTPPGDIAKRIGAVSWHNVAVWLLGTGLVVYVGIEGGGYDPVVHDPVGITLWWVVFLGVAVGAFPRMRLSRHAGYSLALFTGFAAWTALSLLWTESLDATWNSLALVFTYLGLFSFALFFRERGDSQQLVTAVGVGIGVITVLALLSRLHPGWFPGPDPALGLLNGAQERLSYPIGYWNGLAVLIGMGLPLILHASTAARRVAVRCFFAAMLPLMLLALYCTLSRGGLVASFIALVVLLFVHPNRWVAGITLLLAVAGGAFLTFEMTLRSQLQDGLTGSVAEQQGHEMLLICLAIGATVGVLRFWIERFDLPRSPGFITSVSRRTMLAVAGVFLLIGLVVGSTFASDAWEEFRNGGNAGAGSERLSSVAGGSRYELWRVAVDEGRDNILAGTGSGTYEFWWNRLGTSGESVRDAHSLYLQTFGELGAIGLTLLLLFLLSVVVLGAVAVRTASRSKRGQLAAALASCSAFLAVSAFDWFWRIPALSMVFLLMASVLVTSSARSRRRSSMSGLSAWPRLGICLFALCAITAIAIPLATTTFVRTSQKAARQFEWSNALEAAQNARAVMPGAARPRLQEALVLEASGLLAPARSAAASAAEREPTNWINWLTLARLEARTGHANTALRYYRTAKRLNPMSPLFDSVP